MDKKQKELFLQFLDYVHNFIDSLECGESYFKHNGEIYLADMGYGFEFWCQIYGILKEEFSE